MALRTLNQALLNGAGLLLGPARETGIRPGPSPRPRIAFQTYAPHLAQFYRPLIRRLQQEEVDLFFILLPHPELSPQIARELGQYARTTLGITPGHIQPYWRTLRQSYDMVVCNDVYARFPLTPARRWLLWHGAGIPHRFVSNSRLRKNVFDFDRLLTAGRHDAQQIEKTAERRGIGVDAVPAGIPFLDRLLDPDHDNAPYCERLGLDPARKTVLFAPHWGPGTASRAMPTAHFEQCLHVLSRTGYNVVLKPHAWTYRDGRPESRAWGRALEQFPMVRIDRSLDDVPALRQADILVTDGSSRAFNFMLLDRPVILVAQPEFREAVDLDRAQMMQSASWVAQSPSELGACFVEADQNPGRFGAERRRVAERMFSNAGCATEAVSRLILECVNAKRVAG